MHSDATPARSESGLRVTRLAPDVHRVELWGAMPIGWLGNFTRGATEQGLDIVRGHAQRSPARIWSAELEIRSSARFELERADFLALARTPSDAGEPQELELSSFELTRSSGRPGMLELHVRARDRVGFLASLLEHVAGFVLFPEEIGIDTVMGEARDMLVLSSVGGQSPPPELEQSLRVALRSWRNGPSSLWPSV